MSGEFEFHSIDQFVVGTIGMPGDRTFYFQAVNGRQVLSFRCEKGHVSAIVEAIGALTKDFPTTGSWSNNPIPLDLPLMEEWPVGSMQLAYDRDLDQVILVLEELQREPNQSLGKAQFWLTRSQAGAVATWGQKLVAAGRPVCVFCGTSIDPEGFNCACNN